MLGNLNITQVGKIMNYDRELLCKDCRHSYRPWTNRLFFIEIYQCRLPENRGADEYDPVTGKTHTGDFSSCRVARIHTNICGPEGRRWEPRNTYKHMFTMLKKNYDQNT